ncbi:MAG: AMP-binding enzyme [Acidimicrobiales bacterium]
MIISGGENVYCAEVERILLEHPAVGEAAVVGLDDPTWGERVTAVVVAVPGATVDPEEVIGFCRDRLAHYKCPRRVDVVDELPRNPMGKVQKFRLVELLTGAAAPAPADR